MGKKSARSDSPTTSAEKVAIYETTAPLLTAMRDELRELAKKKPEATLNKNKVHIINRLLTDVKAVLEDESDSKYLDLLDEEMLPQYSDVVLILSQFAASMTRFFDRYCPFVENEGDILHRGEHRWSIS